MGGVDSPLNKPKPVVLLNPKVLEAIHNGIKPYQIPEGVEYEYGTAGFRMKVTKGLEHVVFTAGLTAVIRSKLLKEATIGIMITASHNPPEDNGVKLVDPMGDMLQFSFEKYATQLANTPSEDVARTYEVLVNDILVNVIAQNQDRKAKVVFARDTRASGPSLVKALRTALEAVGAEYRDYGYLTTPQLHYMVRCINTEHSPDPFGVATEQGYYSKMARAFRTMIYGRHTNGPVIVDCANGIGAPKLKELIKYLPNAKQGGIDIRVVNDDTLKPELLNHDCGADYVKTKQRAPPGSKAAVNDRCCSLDGDADRLVYYYTDSSGFHLLDGDRIAILSAIFLREMVEKAHLIDKIKVGLVQTAYANGASTEYVKKVLNMPIETTATGVKHLHQAAHHFDIGIYFEANGHGTILFSPKAIEAINLAIPRNPGQKHAIDTLSSTIDLVNQAVGDAISDMLFTEVVLAHKGWTLENWLGIYNDLPNRLVRVVVKDRGLFRAVDAERKLESPYGIQAEIDKAAASYVKGRSFARPSGTEDAVRVYAEAHFPHEAEALATQVENIVKKYG